tara:strand:+ start:307 stop:711 length:405 start_codon:yes stop_codon:yes gene_type:complete
MTHEDFEREENARLKFLDEIREAKELTNKLSDYVNHNRSNKAFIEAFKREHRTLQQSMFKLFLEMVEDLAVEMASDNYHTDGRNEASKNVAKTLIKGFKMAKKEEYMNDGVSEERATEYVSGIGEKPSRYLPLI